METAYKKLSFLAFVLVLPLAACSKKPVNPDNGDRPGIDNPDLKMTRIHLESYGKNQLEWEMTAPEALGYTGRNVVRAKDLKLVMYDNGRVSSHVSADRGVVMTDGSDPNKQTTGEVVRGLRLKSGDMVLDGNVVVTSTDGAKLETDWVWYQRDVDLITSTAPVTLTRADSITRGVGMESTSDLRKVKIFKQKITIRQ